MSHNRPERVAELIHGEVARILREDVSDPRLAALSVTGVRLSADLSLARIHVVPLGGEGDVGEMLKGLKRANGFIRHELGQHLSLRHTPALQFIFDNNVEEAVRLTALLGRLEGQAGEE